MKILTILSDSLALVRPENKIQEKDLYSYKIQQKHNNKIYVVNKSVKNNSSELENRQEALIYNISAASSEFFIIALGIVDCSPRLFSKREKAILECLSKIPLLRKIAATFIRYRSWNRYTITKKRQITDTSPQEYKANTISIIEKIKKYNPVEHIFLINIAYPGAYTISRSYKIEENIILFNSILNEIRDQYPELISIVDLFTFTQQNPQFILSDGHHISHEVHEYIAEKISIELAPLL